MATITDFKRKENPLKIMRTTRYLKIKDVWYVLTIEVDENIEATTKFLPATGRTSEMLDNVGQEELEHGLDNGTILGVL